MTSNVELLPLPEEEWNVRYGYDADAMQSYARANVEHHTEALRAEVERLKALVRSVGHETLTRAEQAEARAERLAEALRDLLSWFPEKPAPSEWRIGAGEQGADDAIEYARAALHPTAAQEDDRG